MNSAADYAWIYDHDEELSRGYCLTLAKGLTPDEVIRRLDGSPMGHRNGFDSFFDLQSDLIDRRHGDPAVFQEEDACEVVEEAVDDERRRARELILAAGMSAPAQTDDAPISTDERLLGVTELAGWVLITELDSFLGMDEDVLRRLSSGTTVVSHYRTINTDDGFSWAENGDVRVSFEPLAPGRRDGSDPDALLDVMHRLGYDVSGDESDDEDVDVVHHDRAGATFALAEHVTGVRITPQVLGSADYLCVTVPDGDS
jgi:hypothetical protein